jgi:LysM repeat protein
MHNTPFRFICILLVFAGSINIFGQFQPAQVDKSSEKILYQGKVYFIHTVKQGQTLYSICKAYGVSQQEIAEANPGESTDIIKPGQVLRIPDKSGQTTNTAPVQKTQDDGFLYHTVKAKENAYYLSKKYNVPEQAIYNFNPSSENGLQIGQVIKIPVKYDASAYQTAKAETDTSKYYTVQSGDTLYNISRMYGVSEAAFIDKNPDLRWGLKPGMKLQIPGKDYLSEVNLAAQGNIGKIAGYTVKQCDSISKVSSSQPVKIALLLPFFANDIFSMDSSFFDSTKTATTQNKIRALGLSSFEFYQGVLLALDSLKKINVNITLYSFDTKSDTNQVNSIIEELDQIKPNLIIGPIKNQNVSLVSEFSEKNKIPLILPMTRASSGVTDGNPYAVFMMPDGKTEIETFADYIAKFSDKNLIVIYQPDTSKEALHKIFREKLFAVCDSAKLYQSKLYSEVRIGDTLRKNLGIALRRNVDNVIVILSNNEASVVNIVGLLAIQSDQIKIKLFGLPSWQHFKNLRSEQLHKLNCTLYSPFFIDYSKPITKSFVLQNRNRFSSEPYKTIANGSNVNFSYLGFETFLLFGKSYSDYRNNILNCVCTLNSLLPQSTYSFKNAATGGYINSAINLIEFTPDFTEKCTTYVSTSDTK